MDGAREDVRSAVDSAAERARRAVAAEAVGNHAEATRLRGVVLGMTLA